MTENKERVNVGWGDTPATAHIIEENVTPEEAWKIMNKHRREQFPAFNGAYFRMWLQDGVTYVDYGSWAKYYFLIPVKKEGANATA